MFTNEIVRHPFGQKEIVEIKYYKNGEYIGSIVETKLFGGRYAVVDKNTNVRAHTQTLSLALAYVKTVLGK